MNRFRRLVKQSGEATTKPAPANDTVTPEVQDGRPDETQSSAVEIPAASAAQVDEAPPIEAAPEATGEVVEPQAVEGQGAAAVAEPPEMVEAPEATQAPETGAGEETELPAAEAAPEEMEPPAAIASPAGVAEGGHVAEAAEPAEPIEVESPAEDATAQTDAETGDRPPTTDDLIPAATGSAEEVEAADAEAAGEEGAETQEPAEGTGIMGAEDVEGEEADFDDVDAFAAPLLAAEGEVASDEIPTGVLTPEQLEDQTAPLTPPAEHEELTALPINAVVDGRYVVQNLLHHGQDRNLYRVTTRKQQRCLTCGRVVPVEDEICPHCGSALNGQPTAEFYLMAESYRPDALMQDPSMMESNLYHPNLVPVIDFFDHKPFGHVRYYAVAEPRQGVRLSQLSLPRPGMQVLSWAMQLSDALDYLHSRGVVGAGAEADDILVQGDRASLASLQNARANVSDAEELAQQQGMDLARLASTMYEAFTGQPASMNADGMLPMPSSAPEQVGAAFRAAIEPVQGMAPPISAARWRDLLAAALEAVSELERPGRPVGFLSAGHTDVGRLREQNQDSFGMVEFTQASVERPMRLGLYLVADGLGGHKGGEIASALAVQAFCGEIMSRIISSLAAASGDRSLPGNDAILQGMVRAVQSANERIYKARDNRQNDMGTTVVSALIAGGKAYIVNVGDSRIYLYAKPNRGMNQENGAASPVVKGTSPLAGTTPLKGTNILDPAAMSSMPIETAPIDRSEYELTQVSVDHSLVHRLVELGQLDPEEAKVHPHRNFIYRSLGGAPPIEVDTFVRTLHPGDRLLLCSDGLNSMIEDADMEDVLASSEDPQVAAQRLIDLANEAGGHDNITAIVVDITGYLPLPEHPAALANT